MSQARYYDGGGIFVHLGDKGNDGGSSEAGESPGLPEKDGKLHTDIETA